MTTQEIQFRVQADQLTALGARFAHGASLLSPLKAVPGAGTVSPVVVEGVTDAAGVLAAHLVPTFQSLAGTTASAKLSLHTGDSVFQSLICFAADGAKAVALINTPEGIAIRHPAPCGEILSDLGDYLGGSGHVRATFTVTLPAKEALAFAGLLDLHRRAVFRALADGVPVPSAGHTPEAILGAARQSPDSFQWFASVVRSLLPANRMEDHDLSPALAGLAAKGLVLQAPDGFLLSPAAKDVAHHFLWNDLLLTVSAAHQSGDMVVAAEMCFLQSGVRDILCLQANNDELFLTALAAQTVLEQVGRILTDPEVLPVPPASVTATPPTADSGAARGSCVQCGKPLQGGDVFCGSCGAPVRTASGSFCRNCGKAVEPGQKFCQACGTPVN